MTSTELGYLSGVTSNIQTQLDNRLEIYPYGNITTNTDFRNDLDTYVYHYNAWNGNNNGYNLPPIVDTIVFYSHKAGGLILKIFGIGSDYLVVGYTPNNTTTDIKWRSIPLTMFATDGTYYGSSFPSSPTSGQLFFLKS